MNKVLIGLGCFLLYVVLMVVLRGISSIYLGGLDTTTETGGNIEAIINISLVVVPLVFVVWLYKRIVKQ